MKGVGISGHGDRPQDSWKEQCGSGSPKCVCGSGFQSKRKSSGDGGQQGSDEQANRFGNRRASLSGLFGQNYLVRFVWLQRLW